jgi:hypothetical protein
MIRPPPRPPRVQSRAEHDNTFSQFDGKASLMYQTLRVVMVVAVAWSSGAHAEEAPVQSPEVRAMIKEWLWLNDRCRAGPSGSIASARACADRDALGPTINDAGWCYGIEDQPESEFTWGLCDIITNYFPRPGEPDAGEMAPIDPPESGEDGETAD